MLYDPSLLSYGIKILYLTGNQKKTISYMLVCLVVWSELIVMPLHCIASAITEGGIIHSACVISDRNDTFLKFIISYCLRACSSRLHSLLLCHFKYIYKLKTWSPFSPSQTMISPCLGVVTSKAQVTYKKWDMYVERWFACIVQERRSLGLLQAFYST